MAVDAVQRCYHHPLYVMLAGARPVLPQLATSSQGRGASGRAPNTPSAMHRGTHFPV